MSSKRRVPSNLVTMPIASFQYRHLAAGNVLPLNAEDSADDEPTCINPQASEDALNQRLASERAAGFAEAEVKLRQEYEARSEQETARLSAVLLEFEKTRKSYFNRVEAEVVKLSLAIAGKIIHREAQVDPMLIAAIVQLALGQLKEGTSASIRVYPGAAAKYKAHFQAQSLQLTVTIVEDDKLDRGDCILETELGAVNFSLDAQLKEVEHGFFDVLAQKPTA